MSIQELQDVLAAAKARIAVLQRRQATIRGDIAAQARKAGLSLEEFQVLFG